MSNFYKISFHILNHIDFVIIIGKENTFSMLVFKAVSIYKNLTYINILFRRFRKFQSIIKELGTNMKLWKQPFDHVTLCS